MPDGDVLAGRLAELRGRYPECDQTMIAEVVRAVLATMSGDLSAHEASLLAEVEELGRTIAAAKAEIADINVGDITLSHIPSATDELDAIVAHTAAATDAILETCETLDRVGAELKGDAAVSLQDATTRIYEACSFQDITGQRITKVVSTLKAIDAKVAHIMQAFGGRAGAPSAADAPKPQTSGDLLNGPQLPTNAMDQSDIDALLASFD